VAARSVVAPNGRAPAAGPGAHPARRHVQAITWWLDNDRPCPPRQIAEQSARLASAMITEAKGWSGTPDGG
jgi:hypothetical protein